MLKLLYTQHHYNAVITYIYCCSLFVCEANSLMYQVVWEVPEWVWSSGDLVDLCKANVTALQLTKGVASLLSTSALSC